MEVRASGTHRRHAGDERQSGLHQRTAGRGPSRSLFPFAKEPIAGVRPIEEMLDVTRDPVPSGERMQVAFGRESQPNLMEISTPLSLAGFTRSAFDPHFAPELRAMGLEPMQGALGGRRRRHSRRTDGRSGRSCSRGR